MTDPQPTLSYQIGRAWKTSANFRKSVVFTVLAAVALVAFIIWAVQTEDRIVQYEGDKSHVVDRLLREGWHVEHTDSMKKKTAFDWEEPVTVVTLERSNWSKLWND